MRFAYTAANNLPTSLMPLFPLSLKRQNKIVEVTGLLDTGAAVNVLPYRVGLELGAVWEQQTTSIPLVGSLGQFEARALLVSAFHPQINANNPIHLAFAWTKAEEVPVILGQMNFFMEFDVCFYRSQNQFDVRLKGK